MSNDDLSASDAAIAQLRGELASARAMIADLRSELEAQRSPSSDDAAARERALSRLAAIEDTGVGVFELDIPSGTIEFSDHWCAITGYGAGEGTRTIEFLMGIVHPDDLPMVSASLEDVVAGTKAVHAIEYRLEHEQGHWIWVQSRSVISARDERNEALRITASTVEVTERRLAVDALRESETRFRVLADGAPVVLFVNDTKGGVQFVNRGYCDYFGIKPEQVEGGKWRPLVHPDDSESYLHHFLAAVSAQVSFRGELRVRRGDGEWRSAETIAEPRFSPNGVYLGHVGIIVDLTDRKQAEEERARLQNELLHAQKLESVGRLAGGVAHDFNNMLAVILGGVDLALLEECSEELRSSLLDVRGAAERSADLTRQLLAFARKQPTLPTRLDVNEKMTGMLPILARLIGENIGISWQPSPGLWPTKIDPVQFDQVVTNLCVNARDSIAGMGKIRMFANNVSVDKALSAKHSAARVGDFVKVTVQDDGSGMDEETQNQIFEPFFTTRGGGRGTGLGLAMVYGIVQQHNGFILVSSTLDVGTTLEIFLPRLEDGEAVDQRVSEPPTDPAPLGGETILLVEDEVALSRTVTKTLDRLGYRVMPATTPSEALRLARAHRSEIDLLLTDVVMPEMNGRKLAETVTAEIPGLKCVFMSGYTADIIAEHGVLGADVMFIEKPFSSEQLAAKLQAALRAD